MSILNINHVNRLVLKDYQSLLVEKIQNTDCRWDDVSDGDMSREFVICISCPI